jgi:acetyl-CoA synthetase
MAEPDDDYLERWRAVADTLTWNTPYTEVHRPDPPYDDWFVGGRMNVTTSCLDRHLPGRADHPAVYWEGEPGDRQELTYRDLHERTVRLAA